MAGRIKGSLEGVLPMMGLLILAAILSMQSLPIGEALASVTEESGEDIAALTEGQTVSEHFMYTYMPAAMKYSMNNAAYELKDGGINWENEASSVSEPHHIVGSIVDEWESETTPRIDSRLDSHHCSIEHDLIMRVYPGESGYSLYTTDNITEADVEAFTFNPVKISCNSETEYINQTYSGEASASNRYIELAKASSSFFYNVTKEFDSASIDSNYEGSGSACGSSSDAYENAKDDAENDYESDTPSVSNIGSGISIPEGINLNTSQDDHYVVTGSESSSGSCCDTECTSRNENGTCTASTCVADTQYSDVDLSPTSSSIDLEVVDEEMEIITKDGFQNLEIDVNDFDYNH